MTGSDTPRTEAAAKTCALPHCSNIVEDAELSVCDACKSEIAPPESGGEIEIETQSTGKEPKSMDLTELEQSTETIAEGSTGADEPKKICGRCPERGPQPLNNFHKAKQGKFGRSSVCRACKSDMAKAAARVKSSAKSRQSRIRRGATPEASRVPEDVLAVQPASTTTACGLNENERKDAASPAKEIEASPLLLTLDLSDYPELMAEIKRHAKEEDRTPEAQCRWWLRCRLGFMQGLSEPLSFEGVLEERVVGA